MRLTPTPYLIKIIKEAKKELSASPNGLKKCIGTKQLFKVLGM